MAYLIGKSPGFGLRTKKKNIDQILVRKLVFRMS